MALFFNLFRVYKHLTHACSVKARKPYDLKYVNSFKTCWVSSSLSLQVILREVWGFLIKKMYEYSLLSLWKIKRVITRVVDLHPLKRWSIVKVGSLEGRGIESGHRSRRPNNYKLCLHFSLCFFLLLLTDLVVHYPYSHSKLNIFPIHNFY